MFSEIKALCKYMNLPLTFVRTVDRNPKPSSQSKEGEACEMCLHILGWPRNLFFPNVVQKNPNKPFGQQKQNGK